MEDLFSLVLNKYGAMGLGVLFLTLALGYLFRTGIRDTLQRLRQTREEDEDLRNEIRRMRDLLRNDLDELEEGFRNHIDEVHDLLDSEVKDLEDRMNNRLRNQKDEERAWAEKAFASAGQIEVMRHKIDALSRGQDGLRNHITERLTDLKESLHLVLQKNLNDD